MRTLSIIFFLALNWTYVAGQEYQIKWDLSIGTPENDNLYDVIPISDDNLLFVAGTKDSLGYSDYYIIKTDQIGNIEWEHTYGGDNFDFLSAVIETTEGGFLLGGYSRSFTSSPNSSVGHFDYWLLKVDYEGQLEWENSYGGSKYDVMRAMVANDNGYLLVGNTSSNDGDISMHRGGEDAWVVQIDDNGNVIWEKSFGGSEDESFHSVIVLEDQNFIFVGRTKSSDGDVSNNYGDTDVWVVCTDVNGELLWEKTYGGSSFETIGYKNIKQSSDGNFLLYGYTVSSDHDLNDFSGEENGWVWKINKQGVILWSYAFGHEFGETINDVKELEDNKLLLFGGRATIADPFAAANYWLLIIDENDGSIENEQMFGGFSDDWGLRIIESKEEDIILAGISNSNDGDITNKVGMNDIWLACIELKMTSPVGMESEQIININPNPSHDFINIDIPEHLEVATNIYDISGKLLFKNIKKTFINIENLQPGVYFLEIRDLNSKLKWISKIIKN